MKKLIICICLLTSLSMFSQSEKTDVNTTVAINSLKFSADSVEELEAINWEDVREIIKENDPETPFSLEIQLNTSKKNTSKVATNMSAKVSDVSKNYELLIARAEKAIKAIKRMSNKIYNKK
ncbi:hypothetical protein RQM59_00520 [Flavobacteriaceae bacterium S356]|uniref:Uncharacterized protein n=1 Tax=Asprobacillus argus TaxID=3076534 RepID=A0ABU3LAT5_9FLAO|nr:hypothetical protein [Flavobacteriaceae bacterium S356]